MFLLQPLIEKKDEREPDDGIDHRLVMEMGRQVPQ
jgi:hypothetical protein